MIFIADISMPCFHCLFVGFGDRLVSEIKKGAPKDVKIKVCMCGKPLFGRSVY